MKRTIIAMTITLLTLTISMSGCKKKEAPKVDPQAKMERFASYLDSYPPAQELLKENLNKAGINDTGTYTLFTFNKGRTVGFRKDTADYRYALPKTLRVLKHGKGNAKMRNGISLNHAPAKADAVVSFNVQKAPQDWSYDQVKRYADGQEFRIEYWWVGNTDGKIHRFDAAPYHGNFRELEKNYREGGGWFVLPDVKTIIDDSKGRTYAYDNDGNYFPPRK